MLWRIRSLSFVALAAFTASGSSAGEATVKGSLAVGGKTAPLLHVRVMAEPDVFFKGKTGYRVVLSDVAGLPDRPLGSPDKLQAGTLHYVDLVLGHDKTVRKAFVGHNGFPNGYVSSAAGLSIAATSWGPDTVAGTIRTTSPQEHRGVTYSFEVTFAAPVAE